MPQLLQLTYVLLQTPVRYLSPSHPRVLHMAHSANAANAVYEVGFANISKEHLLFMFSVVPHFICCLWALAWMSCY